MDAIRNCAISATLLEQWATVLVTENAPFFISDQLHAQLFSNHLVFTRAEFSAMDFALSFVDSYRTYAVSAAAPWVVLLQPSEFDALSATAQTALVAEQWQFGRGQVYPWLDVQPLVATLSDNGVSSRQSTTSNGSVLLLDTHLWSQLTPALREQWLIQFVTQQQPPYPIIPCAAVAWSYLADCHTPWIKNVANTFTATSGPNCLATTLAAITPAAITAATIGTMWLHQEPFLRGLHRCGYTRRSEKVASFADLNDAVLLWRDQHQVVQHACYILGAGVALNKNAQTWYSARELVAVTDVLTYWADEPFTLTAYTREQ